MSDSEIKESDELINDIQRTLWSDSSEHLPVNEITKKEGLVKLFLQIEPVFNLLGLHVQDALEKWKQGDDDDDDDDDYISI